MKKYLLTGTLIAIFAVTCYAATDRSGFKQQQREMKQQQTQKQKMENIEFRKSLKGMTPAQKKEAIKKHIAERKMENLAFRKDRFEANKATLQKKLDANKNLSDADKKDIMKAFEEGHSARSQFREQQYKENSDFAAKVANDPSLTKEQKKAAIKEHFKKQKEENKKFAEEQKKRSKELQKQMEQENEVK